MFDIIARVSAATDVDTTLNAIAQGAIKLTQTPLSVIRLIKQYDEHYIVSQMFQYPTEANTTTSRLELGTGITHHVITTGELYISHDIFSDMDANPELKELDFRSMIVVPLLLQNEVVGALYLYDKKQRAFTHNEQALLKSLANHAAVAIARSADMKNRQLFQQASTTLTEQLKGERPGGSTDFFKILADQLRGITESCYVSVVLLTGQTLSKVAKSGNIAEEPIVRKSGLSSELMRTRQYLHIQNTQRYEVEREKRNKTSIHPSTMRSQIVTLLGLPLVIAEAAEMAIGVIWVHYDKTRLFKPNEITDIQSYVNQAALIYHSIRKYDMSAERSKILRDRLYKVSERLDIFSISKIARANEPVKEFCDNLLGIFPQICSIFGLHQGFLLINDYNQNNSFAAYVVYPDNKKTEQIELSKQDCSELMVEGEQFIQFFSSLSSQSGSIPEPINILNEYIEIAEKNYDYEAATLSITPDDHDNTELSIVMVFINRVALTDDIYHSLESQYSLFDRLRSTIRSALYSSFRVEKRIIEDRKRETLYFHLAHEIGTPLMGLTASANALANDLSKVNEKHFDMATHILKQSQKLHLMSETMLAAIGDPPSIGKAYFRKHNLFEALMDASEMFKSEAIEKGCEIKQPFAKNGVFPDIMMSVHDVTIAFKNLISNAVKYSFYPSPQYETERYIKIIGDWDSDDLSSYKISFQNYGIGITQGEIDEGIIFRPFTRGVNSNDRFRTGKGVGLAQVRFAVEDLHSGKVFVTSNRLWGNAYLTTFEVILPIEKIN